jgi:AcrR family transcriptional regulator
MGRPRKDSAQPQAVIRLVDAFWTLLEDYLLKEITVSMVAAEAGCNRGTFYYHFDDMSELIDYAIEKEITGNQGLYRVLFQTLTKTEGNLVSDCVAESTLVHLALLIDRGGWGKVDIKLKRAVADMWRTLLCDGDEELEFDSLLIIEYSVSGLIGMIRYVCRCAREGQEIPDHVDVEALHSSTLNMMRNLARIQGVDMEELALRLRMYDKLMQQD